VLPCSHLRGVTMTVHERSDSLAPGTADYPDRRARKVTQIALAAIALVLVGLQGCSDRGCDEGTINRAIAFLDAHQNCTTNDDCTVVADHCGELPGGFCGQLPMSREGAESAEWKSLEREVHECAPESCTVCGAALIPTCTNGSCRGGQP
jgi:hypothetical protein